MIYLDHAATTPVSESALKVFTEVSTNFYGNTSSLHDVGSSAKGLLDHCRESLAHLIDAPTKGVYFTSGGTESNILAIRALLRARQHKGNHLITTTMEHSSLYNYFQYLENEWGFEVTYLEVNQEGQISTQAVRDAIQDNTILASIHHANSEVGVIQPLSEIGEILQRHDILFHSDCVQSFGKLPINIQALNLDSLSISSHKIYGPKGVGAAYVNPLLSWKTDPFNQSQENGFRPGTINTPGIAAFVTAAQEICESYSDTHDYLVQLQAEFAKQFKELGIKGKIVASPQQLPNIIGIVLDSVQGDYAMLELNRLDIAVSTGSACSVGQQKPSKTLLSLGYTEEEAKRFIRLSMGKHTSKHELDKVLDALITIL
ncbi:IscS subfamily cysteine desulfurase [Aquibacillus kalidii]|uniref:IscS subfamily cysteine desulfurase n=1 Tax=Aquibacillus kalidii TaxID=2762597 RepID=UPI0016457CFB|nr:IscS subfamily cysteine desulfurase [Aquibacillus kalidii]